MIQTLRIGNFKAFAETQTVPIRPLTLIYGPNSAGKSSIIHSLALAHHAMRTGILDTYRTQIGGESIDLGGFRQYVHRRDDTRRMEWTLELDTKRIVGRLAELLVSAQTVAMQIFIGVRADAAAGVQACNLLIDGAAVVTMSARPDGRFRIDRLDQTHRIFRDIIHGIVLMGTTTDALTEADLARVDSLVDELVPQLSVVVERLVPRMERWESPEEELTQSLLMPVGKGTRGDDLRAAVRAYFPRVLRELIDGVSTLVEQSLDRFRYLGPLRSYPPRHLAFSADHDTNWSAGGGEAWDIVRRRDDVRERVNQWLGDRARLSTPYRIEPRRLFEVEAVSDAVARLAYEHDIKSREFLFHEFMEVLGGDLGGLPEEKLAVIREEIFTRQQDLFLSEDQSGDRAYGGDGEGGGRGDGEYGFPGANGGGWGDPDALDHLLARAAEGKSIATDLALIDQRTMTAVSHRDVGIGVSQVLPVLVNAYSMREKLIAIEQPEIHLHPALQAELGDVFIDSALGSSRNTFLLETHSEHLLLRIMRRMRETSEGKASGKPIRPADVAVLFVDPAGATSSIVREMPLNERGELMKAWPGGFFEEGLREVF